MRQFTDKDILTIKSNLLSLITHIQQGYDTLIKYVQLQILTDTQRSVIMMVVQNPQFKCSLEPLSPLLLPLIDVVKYHINKSGAYIPPPLPYKTKSLKSYSNDLYYNKDYIGLRNDEYFDEYLQ